MGHPATARPHVRAKTPRLALVRGRTAKVRRHVSARAARDLCTFFVLVFSALCVFGLGRVALSARAFDDALATGHLEKAIKAERLEGDLLEVDKSALATPSRIESIAGVTMQMAEAGDVCYLAMPCEPDASAGMEPDIVSGAGDVSERTSGVNRIVQAVKGLASSEVQSLLLGDVGLASSK